MLQRYIGDKAFYRRALATALPIILQNLITNFVAMLDNVMVGQLATAQISAVTIANNNLLFIFNLCMFGCASSAGIFTTQFHGSGNQEGIRHTFRFKLLSCLLLTAAAAAIFWFGSDPLVRLYLRGEGDPQLAADTLFYGRQYLHIMILGLIPFSVTNAYAGTLRECGHPTVPMVAGIVATAVNLVGNYILIFGHFGACHGGFPLCGAGHCDALDPLQPGEKSLHPGSLPQHPHPQTASSLHPHQGIPPDSERNPVLCGPGIFEPVLQHLRPGCSSRTEHFHHHL